MKSQTSISAIAPFFITRNVYKALAFYRDQLGFEITFQSSTEEDIFFGIVQRGAANSDNLRDFEIQDVDRYAVDRYKSRTSLKVSSFMYINLHISPI